MYRDRIERDEERGQAQRAAVAERRERQQPDEIPGRERGDRRDQREERPAGASAVGATSPAATVEMVRIAGVMCVPRAAARRSGPLKSVSNSGSVEIRCS